MDKDAVQGVIAVGRGEGKGELAEAAEREWEFRVYVEGGCVKAPTRSGQLCTQEELQAELGLATTTLGN